MKKKMHLIRKLNKNSRAYLVTEYKKSKPKKIEYMDELYFSFLTICIFLMGIELIYPTLYSGLINRNPVYIITFIIGIIFIITSFIAYKCRKSIPW